MPFLHSQRKYEKNDVSHTAIGYVISVWKGVRDFIPILWQFSRVSSLIDTYVFHRSELDRMAHAFLGCNLLGNHRNPFFSDSGWNVPIDKLRKTETIWLTHLCCDDSATIFFHQSFCHAAVLEIWDCHSDSSTWILKLRLCSMDIIHRNYIKKY